LDVKVLADGTPPSIKPSRLSDEISAIGRGQSSGSPSAIKFLADTLQRETGLEPVTFEDHMDVGTSKAVCQTATKLPLRT